MRIIVPSHEINRVLAKSKEKDTDFLFVLCNR